MAKKVSLEERLQRHPAAREVGGMLGRGIDRLPVNELTRTMLKYKTSEVVVSLAETGAALSTAARESADTYQQARDDETGYPMPGRQPSTGQARRASPDAGYGGDDLTVRLERLAKLHADGHLDDEEYLVAKAKVLGLG